MKALFIPLKSEYYEAFANGTKTEELRKFGPRWNSETCKVGRKVILSKGYGKESRLAGTIWKFKVQAGTTFSSTYRAEIYKVFGTLFLDIACISIELDKDAA